MKQIKEKLKQISTIINLDNDFIILDVDRTIINTTSWYRACVEPNLLIDENNILEFKKINDETFKKPTPDKLKKFREDTFKLISKRITDEFIIKIQKLKDFNSYFIKGKYTDLWRFYVAGCYTSNYLIDVYEEAIDYIRYSYRYYGNNLKIIFLTSGYETFIRGVVDKIMDLYNISSINYSVIGSEIEFKYGIPKEIFHMSQKDKKDVVEYIINSGGKVRFLADDSNENKDLFKIVNEHNGIALNIMHEKNKRENSTWKNFLSMFNKDFLKEKLQREKYTIGLEKSNMALPSLANKIAQNTNDIGILSTSITEYDNALKLLLSKFTNQKDRVKFCKNINKIVFQKEDKVYYRGKIYYIWLPQYIFIDNRSINERWKEQINISLNSLKIVLDESLISKSSSVEEKIIIYALIDHLIESVFYLLNLCELNSLEGDKTYEKEHGKIIKLSQYVTDLLFAFLYESSEFSSILKDVITKANSINLISGILRYTNKYKTMRELDNNITIFKTVKNIADNIEEKHIDLDYIISFPYGGIMLGYAYRSYLRFGLKKERKPKLLNCHFSSKQNVRDKITQKDKDFSMYKFIPKIYNNYVDSIKKGRKTILLLDNNITTCKTLDLCKNFLNQIGNDVYAAVSAVNYDNIVEYLLGRKSEKMVLNWISVLDFKPIEEYVTAFNTWNTSLKSKRLQEIYYISKGYQKIKNEKYINVNINKEFVFKVCRVQNVQDLNTIIKNGANMIGIHAVYPDRIKYLNNEIKYSPINTAIDVDEKLPVGVLEIASIRDIQRFIPNGIKQAVLFEKDLNNELIKKTFKLYNIPIENAYIQLQYRTNEDRILNLKSYVCNNLIVTIGLFQKDFKSYFDMLDKKLNPKTDYILLDLSKHQPDLISFSESYKDSIDKVAVLNNVARYIKNNKVPIIVADDTTPSQMKEYLKVLDSHDIYIKGVDMQNSLEFNSREQKYQMVECMGKKYQIKIRKSGTELARWCDFLDNLDIEYFKNRR